MWPAFLSPLLWLTFLSCIITGLALMCYECESTKAPDCGPRFRYSSFNAKECFPNVTHCGLQRQELDPSKNQVAGIRRGCYVPGLHVIDGLNDSTGCRHHTMYEANGISFTSLYCFCDTDMCNGSQNLYNLPLLTIWIPVFFAVLYLPINNLIRS